MASVAGRAPRSAPVFTRLFWSAAAVLLVALIVRSLPTELRALPVAHTVDAPAVEGTLRCADRSVDFHITGLPACPEGKCYQLWHIGTDGKPIPLGTFHPGPDGSLCGADATKRPVGRDHLLAFTMEPEGGSRNPTMPIYAFAKY